MDVTGAIDTGNPELTSREVRRIYSGLFEAGLFGRVEQVLGEVTQLFAGRYQGYDRCDTAYHDFEHTLQTYLAAARIFDGMVRTDPSSVSMELVTLGLISALGHDTGFIKPAGDNHGHGGKYTLVHVERSKDFMGNLLQELGFSDTDISCVRNAISCTGLNVKVSSIPFASAMESTVGYVVGTADYLGQMSDPHYIEKLPGLYEEYREGGVPGYDSADSLIEKTPGFFEGFVMNRLTQDFCGVYRFAASHFGGRDLYIEGIRKNLAAISGARSR